MMEPKITINHELLTLIAEIDQFKGSWEAFKNMAPERLSQLRRVATIESVGSSFPALLEETKKQSICQN